jgi:hypothetical protein
MLFSHPSPENKTYAVEVLATVFGKGIEKFADGQKDERTRVVCHMSENQKYFKQQRGADTYYCRSIFLDLFLSCWPS